MTPAEVLGMWPRIELLYNQGEMSFTDYCRLRELADQERNRIAASSCFFVDDCVDSPPPNVQAPNEASTAPPEDVETNGTPEKAAEEAEQQDAPPPPQEEQPVSDSQDTLPPP